MSSAKLTILGFFSVLLAACGSVVVPGDPSGTGGSGGSGGSGSGASGPTTTTTASGNPVEACQTICGKFAEFNCPDQDDCANECPQAVAQFKECQNEFVTLLLCMSDNFIDCSPDPAACQSEQSAFEECLDVPPQPCSESECDAGSDGTNQLCKCGQLCGPDAYVAACVTPGGGPTQCDCYINEALVGTCEDANVCPADGVGCCEPFFFQQEG